MFFHVTELSSAKRASLLFLLKKKAGTFAKKEGWHLCLATMTDKTLIGNITDLGNGVRVNLLRSDSVPAPETFLSTQELMKYASFKIEKRRRDWLGGRYAAKTLLKKALGLQTPLSAIVISYDPFGRPVGAGGEITQLLSITHSGPFCAAAAGPAGAEFIGIDLEKAEPRAGAWYQDYFYKDELPVHDINAATRLWTQKEALLKALGLGLTADLLDINLMGGIPEFSRAALKRYEELCKPAFKMATFEPEPGWYLTVVS